jgi:beta-mannosidase
LYLGEDFELAYQPPRFNLSTTKVLGGIEITITAENFLRELCVFVDRIDDQSEVSDAVVNLLANEQITLMVQTDKPELFTEAAIRQVTRCVNEFRTR